MLQKIFQIICVLAFFLSFGYFFGTEYWEFHDKIQEQAVFQDMSLEKSKNFSIDNLDGGSKKIDIWQTPSTDFLEKLVTEIDEAEKRVLVEVYIFTERDMRDALVRAHERGVEVKILLENNPYKAPYLNDDHYELFRESGIDVEWSDPLNYSLNHSKLLIIDEKAYVSTGNFSYSTFTKNRDFFIEIGEYELVTKLRELFYLDFNHKLGGVFHPKLVISPYSSRQKIEALIEGAEKSIDFYFPYLADDRLRSILPNWKTGIIVRGIVGKDYADDQGIESINKAQSSTTTIRVMEKPKLHAKAILVDQEYLYIGSINFSTYSLDENREIGLIITNPHIISEFRDIFESDFALGKRY